LLLPQLIKTLLLPLDFIVMSVRRAEAAVIVRLAAVLQTLQVPVDVVETWPYSHACTCQGPAFSSASLIGDGGGNSPRFYGPYCVGVDLSGDPTRGDLPPFLPILQGAREAGLKIAIHCGETMNVREAEAVLDFHPDRLGHMAVMVRCSL